MSAQLDMFSTKEEREIENAIGKFMMLPVSELIEFKDHPFPVVDDEDMYELQESIRDNGLMDPILVFLNEDGQLEIISGHRRAYVYDNLGIETIPAIVKNITRDDATVIMTDTNFKTRKQIPPSVKAKAYEMTFQALKRQGKRTDLLGEDTINSRDEITKKPDVTDSSRQIGMYRRLNYLIPQLLNLVDQGRIKLRPAVELSFIRPDSQKEIYNFYEEYDSTPSHAQAKMLRELDKNNILTQDKILEILKKPKETQEKPFTLSEGLRAKYFSDCITQKDMENKIIRALKLLETQERIESGISR